MHILRYGAERHKIAVQAHIVRPRQILPITAGTHKQQREQRQQIQHKRSDDQRFDDLFHMLSSIFLPAGNKQLKQLIIHLFVGYAPDGLGVFVALFDFFIKHRAHRFLGIRLGYQPAFIHVCVHGMHGL